MAKKKKSTTDQLWEKRMKSINFKQFVEQTANTYKMIVYGETSVGKSTFWIKIIEALKAQGVKPEDTCFQVIYPDRATGITKLAGEIDIDYINNIDIYPISKYEELISATATAEEKLLEHFRKTGHHGWMVHELLGQPWIFAQDYYTRKAYGKELGNFFAEMKQRSKAIREDSSAYKAMDGWKDWPVIKFFHNYQWIDKIKVMPFNVLFTAEVKTEGRADSIFKDSGRPAGEKDDMHRVDEILKLRKEGNQYYMKPYKLTGYTKVYPEQKITNNNPFIVHQKMKKRLEKEGYCKSNIQQAEEQADIKPPKKPKAKPKESPKEEPPEEDDW